MFIIFGSPRSGTTFLKEALSSNTNIFIPNETDFIIPVAFALNRLPIKSTANEIALRLITESKGFENSLGKFLSRTEVELILNNSESTLPSILMGLYKEIAKKKGAAIGGDKSPNDLSYIGILHECGLFQSTVKLIHIVRDYRDVMLSIKRAGWIREGGEQFFPGIWASLNGNLKRLGKQNPNNYCLLRYEDLISNTEAKLREACSFLGVEFQGNMIQYENYGKELRTSVIHKNLGLPPLTENCYKWKNLGKSPQSFDPRGEATFTANEFGYE